MRILFFLLITTVFLVACNKDKFTTVPQIKFKSITRDSYSQGALSDASAPVITIHVTDAEGDLGFTTKDTSYIYLKNLRTNDLDSVTLPDISKAAVKKFEADIDINLRRILRVPNASKKDTLYYDIYLKDFAKNKSNVIRTEKPIFYFP
ncbi:MAG: hypothetical protein ABJA78_19105 [Ferruginibacter sp.]